MSQVTIPAGNTPEPGPNATGLRAAKKSRTRRALRSAALRLFSERGVESTTVEDIAAAADVSPRTFFRYFETKLDVLDLDDEVDALPRMEAALLASPDAGLFEVIAATAITVAADVSAMFDPDELRATYELLARPEVLEAAGGHYLEAEREAYEMVVRVRPDVPRSEAALVIAAVIAATRAAFLTWAEEGGQIEPILAGHLRLLGSGLDDVGRPGR